MGAKDANFRLLEKGENELNITYLRENFGESMLPECLKIAKKRGKDLTILLRVIIAIMDNAYLNPLNMEYLKWNFGHYMFLKCLIVAKEREKDLNILKKFVQNLL